VETTRRFYEDIVGTAAHVGDRVDIDGVGVMRHVFFDCGDGQLIAFSSGEDAPGFPKSRPRSTRRSASDP